MVAVMSSRDVKVITLGAGQAGKTCLLMKAVHKDYVVPAETQRTIGVDFKVKTYDLDSKQQVKMHIWDTAGQERFFQINRMYYKGVSAVLFIFDLADEKSFQAVEFFWNDFHQFSDADGTVYKVLVGSKSDLPSREISASAAQAWADAHAIPYIETSALAGTNVEELFSMVLKGCLARPVRQSSGRFKDLAHSRERKKKKSWCSF